MKFLKLGAAVAVGIQGVKGEHGEDGKPEHHMDVHAAARIARKMAFKEDLLHANTIDRESGQPVSFVEYFVGSDSCRGVETSQHGNIILLLLNMSSTYQNWHKNSKFSTSLEAHPRWHFKTPMSSPRANYFGKLKPLERSAELDRCFLRRHPDAHWWLPGDDHDKVHDGQWFELDVSHVYFVGGFGDRAYIGPISGEEYHGAFNHTDPWRHDPEEPLRGHHDPWQHHPDEPPREHHKPWEHHPEEPPKGHHGKWENHPEEPPREHHKPWEHHPEEPPKDHHKPWDHHLEDSHSNNRISEEPSREHQESEQDAPIRGIVRLSPGESYQVGTGYRGSRGEYFIKYDSDQESNVKYSDSQQSDEQQSDEQQSDEQQPDEQQPGQVQNSKPEQRRKHKGNCHERKGFRGLLW